VLNRGSSNQVQASDSKACSPAATRTTDLGSDMGLIPFSEVFYRQSEHSVTIIEKNEILCMNRFIKQCILEMGRNVPTLILQFALGIAFGMHYANSPSLSIVAFSAIFAAAIWKSMLFYRASRSEGNQ
jgi:hypothetical protein